MKDNTLRYLYPPLSGGVFSANASQRSRYPFEEPLPYFSIGPIRYVSVRGERYGGDRSAPSSPSTWSDVDRDATGPARCKMIDGGKKRARACVCVAREEAEEGVAGRWVHRRNNGECRAWPQGGSPRELFVFQRDSPRFGCESRHSPSLSLSLSLPLPLARLPVGLFTSAVSEPNSVPVS